MPEKYRIICRQLSEKGKVRALLLRDPTPVGPGDPSPFLHGDPEGKRPHQWLPDCRYTLVLPKNDVFRNVKYQKVEVTKVEGIEADASKKFAISKSDGFSQASIQLFQPFREILSKDTPEEKVVDATASFSAEAKGKPEGSDQEVDLGCPGIAALLEVFWSDEDLDVLAQMGLEPDGRPGVITMAVLSGFVIDLTGMPTQNADQLPGSITDKNVQESREVTFSLLIPEGYLQKLSLPLELHQTAAGCHINVDWRLMKQPEAYNKNLADHWFCYHNPETRPDGFQVDKSELEDATLVLFRSVGPVASGGEEKVGRFPVMVKNVAVKPPGKDPIVFDALGAKRFVGERLHYRLELRNAVDAVVASGYIADERLRLDHPRPSPYAEALIDKDKILSIRMEYPDEYANLEPIVWFQRRTLDPCGYYGTDDDMALEEGLRQADMNYNMTQGEGFDVEGDWAEMPAFQSLQGKYGKYGLHEFVLENNTSYDEGYFESEGSEDKGYTGNGTWRKIESGKNPSRRRRVITKLSLPKEENEGYRFYVGWRRTNGGESAPESKLKLCAHFLKSGGKDEECRRVFQLENVPDEQPPTEWLDAKDITVMLCDEGSVIPQPNEVIREPNEKEREGKATPYTVRISVHAAEHANGALGGFRIYARDLLGPDHKPPVQEVGEYEVITSSVYRYRPYRLDQSRKLLPPDLTRENWDYPSSGKKRDEVEAWFQKLAQVLQDPGNRNQLGRLVVDPGKLSENKTPAEEKRAAAQPPHYSKVVVEKLVADLKIIGITDHSFPPALPGEESERKKWRKLNQDLRSSWDLLGPFLRWAVDAGFARDLILPYSINRTDQLEDWFKVSMEKNPPKEMSVRVFAVSFPQPAAQALVQPETADLVMATMRILVIPSDAEWLEITGYDDESTKLLKWALKCALTGAKDDGGELRVFREAKSDPDWLVMDPSGWASLEWDGIGDTWHHRLEFAVERMDRYRKARNYLNSSKEVDEVSEWPKCRKKQLEVIRREPPPGPPGILPLTDPYRVGFRILETAQREAASHNALAQMRYGDIALMTRLTVSFPWAERYKNITDLLNESQTDSEASVPEGKWERWQGADMKEERNAPFFLSFEREVRWKADNLAGTVASAEWQRQPTCISNSKEPFLEFNTIISGEATLTCRAPVIRLWDLLTKEEQEHPLAQHEWVNKLSAKNLPDLETAYSLFHRTNDNSPYRKVLELIPPKPDEPLNRVFGYTLSPKVQVVKQELEIINGDQWQIDLTVTGLGDDFSHTDWKWVITRNELSKILEV